MTVTTATMQAQTNDQYDVYLQNDSSGDTDVPDSLINDSIPNDRDTYQVDIPYYQYKSPEAAAFRRYGEYAVNEYTGNPNISVPIHTLSYKDIEIPITLTYDGTGVKVDQEASWVGLGWNLMVGGCINYVAAGDVDPRTLNSTASAWEDFVSQGSGDIYTFMDNIVEISNNQNVLQPIQDDLLNGYGETDFFSANFLGQSFMFMYDRSNGQYRIIGNGSDVYKIEDTNQCSYANIDNARWKITDGNGTQYYFMKVEMTNGKYFQSLYTSAWYLDQIITPEGSAVYFSYTTDTYMVPWRAMMYEQNDFVISTTPIALPMTGPNAMVTYPGSGYNSSLTTSAYYVHTHYLSTITTSSETITFTLGDRADLTNAKRLDKISIKSNVSNQTIKEYQFNYSYFTASTVGGDMLTGSHGTFTYDEDKGKRLKLTSVDECAGSTNLRTSFEYNGSVSLPLKTSAAKDFWGYFNNYNNYVNGRLTLLPTPRFLLSETDPYMNNEVWFYSGANRYCNKDAIQAGVLQKIIYPTKGYTMFVFEPHQFVSTAKYPESSYFTTNRNNFTVTDSGNSPTPNTSSYHQMDLSGHAIGSIKVTFSGTLSDLYSNNAYVKITPLNPNMGSTQTYDLSLASQSQIANGSSFIKTIPISLVGTSYMVTAYCPRIGSSYHVSATVDVTVVPTDDNVPVNTGGGLRIKRIENYNHDNVLLDSTAYHYMDANGTCSGRLLQPMIMYDKKEIYRAVQYENPAGLGASSFTILRLKQSSSAMTVFSQVLSRGTIGYSSVTKKTYNAQSSNLSCVESTFQNNTPQLYFNKYYYGTDNNGNLTSQTVKTTNGTPLQKMENSYGQTSSTFGHILLMEDRVMYEISELYNDDGFPRYMFWHFPFKYKWNKLLQTTTTTYNGSNTQVKTTSYDYNTTNHRVWKETSNSSDSNITYLTEYKYPNDFSTQNPCSLMCNTTYHMLYPIIEQSLSAIEGGTTKLIKKRKNTYTSYTNKYRDATYNTRVFLLTGSSFALNGGSLESRLSYVYNNKCDRISITKDTEKVTYLWAYNYMYPVAEIRGATYDELVSWGLSTNISNLATMTTTANVSSALATIRSSLASRPVLMTSYTYDPLIGITSTTAPNGTKTSYTYDVMGRLSNVKNHGGNIIQQHSYNYKTN